MKKLILVDDHAMLRNGIAAWFSANSEWNVFLNCESFLDLRQKFEKVTIEENDVVVAVVDLSFRQQESKLESNTGLEIVKWLCGKNIPSVIFSSHDTGSSIENAMSAEVGAKGFVSKTSSEARLLEAVNTVAWGKTYIQPDLFTGFIESRTIFSALSPKEREIANLVLQNYDNDMIASCLNIKLRTVENYISKLYDKTGTKSRSALIDVLL